MAKEEQHDAPNEEEWECIVQSDENDPVVPSEPRGLTDQDFVDALEEEAYADAINDAPPRTPQYTTPTPPPPPRQGSPAMSDRDYVASEGAVCPFCQSDNIDTDGSWNSDSGYAWLPVRCANCNETYDEIYTLSSYCIREP